MPTDNGWRIEHVRDRQYVIISHLHHDAGTVSLEAFSRTIGKPGGSSGTTETVWRTQLEFVRPEEPVEVDLEPTWPGAPLPFRVHVVWHDEYGQRFDTYLDVPTPDSTRRAPRPDLRAPMPPGIATRASQLAATRKLKPSKGVTPREYAVPVPDVDPREVFVVVGRNTAANDSMFTFLRAINLKPMEWSAAIAATGSGSPYIGTALDAAFSRVKAVVVFMTPDDIAQLRDEYASGPDDPELIPTPQARPNVLLEAGMALGLHPDRTIIVELGKLRGLSDLAGRHTVRIDNSPERRGELANRLKNAGCAVDTSGDHWYRAGDFTVPKAHSGPPATGRRLPSNTKKRVRRLDGRYLHRGSGSDHVQVMNVASEDLFDLTSPNTGEFHGHLTEVEIPRLPVGKSFTLLAMQASGAPDTWDLVVNGRTEGGEEFSESLYLDLNG
ncbi:TIR domain-containing protein [Mycolicibacterium houstonense]|uniref:TIR domain-containing protein n=1 Tax=Mycolicibacterium houstonense TaxID=146021 RepID=UPI003F97DB3E